MLHSYIQLFSRFKSRNVFQFIYKLVGNWHHISLENKYISYFIIYHACQNVHYFPSDTEKELRSGSLT